MCVLKYAQENMKTYVLALFGESDNQDNFAPFV